MSSCVETIVDGMTLVWYFKFYKQNDVAVMANMTAENMILFAKADLCMEMIWYHKWFPLVQVSYEQIVEMTGRMDFTGMTTALFYIRYAEDVVVTFETLKESRKFLFAIFLYQAFFYMEKRVLSGYLSQINLKSVLAHNAWTLDNNLISCQIGSETCTIDDFDKIFTANGVCYQLNKNFKQSIPNKSGGITMLINSETYNQFDQVIMGKSLNGIDLIIHHEDEPPAINFRGLSLEPGMMSDVEIQNLTTTLLDKEVGGNCDKLIELDLFDKFTTFGCNMDCLFTNIEQNCGCLAYDDPRIVTDNDYFTKACASFNDLRCLFGTKEGRIPSKPCKDCSTPACHFKDYSPKITSEPISNALISSHIKIKELDCAITNNIPLDSGTYSASPDNISSYYCLTENNWKSNIIGVRIYYDELAAVVSIQTPKYSIIDFLGLVGGFTGLCAGMSFITIIQFVETLFIVLGRFFGRYCSCPSKKF
ncbi:hypothetical protein SNEBB_004108 [Seison nebaliae]|nr:hypothetical protein SNEBB_004108 [Seison nebaliae]